MDRAVDAAGIPADMLHDVDLAHCRPAALAVGGEHPDRRPHAAPAGELGANLDEAIFPVGDPAGDQLARAIVLAAEIGLVGHALAAGFEDQPAALDARVLAPGVGIILQLVVEPALFVEGGVVAPLGGIGQAGTVELVGPDLGVPLGKTSGSSVPAVIGGL